MILAVTGHRPDKLGGWKTPNPTQIETKRLMEKFLISEAPNLEYVITGMAQGVDQWMAELCIENDIPFLAAVPFEGQESVWPPAAQAHYQYLLSKAFKVEYISSPGFEPWKMHMRNQWMVEHCHKLLAVWDGTPGGTAGCVQSAVSFGRDIYYLTPPPAPPPPPKKDWSQKKAEWKTKVKGSNPFDAVLTAPSLPPVLAAPAVTVTNPKPSFEKFHGKGKGWSKSQELGTSDSLVAALANAVEKDSLADAIKKITENKAAKQALETLLQKVDDGPLVSQEEDGKPLTLKTSKVDGPKAAFGRKLDIDD